MRFDDPSDSLRPKRSGRPSHLLDSCCVDTSAAEPPRAAAERNAAHQQHRDSSRLEQIPQKRTRPPAPPGKREKVEEVEVKTVVLGFLRLMPLLILK
jgi:hypothetical protein